MWPSGITPPELCPPRHQGTALSLHSVCLKSVIFICLSETNWSKPPAVCVCVCAGVFTRTQYAIFRVKMHPVRVSIPSFRSEHSSIERGYTVFRIDVLINGRLHTIEKRYSEFHTLHKMLKKSIKPPEIPSKHVRNWVPKVLEQRRQGLELYLQTIIMENETLPKIFLDFLNIRHFPSVPKMESCGSFDAESMESSKLSHQPVMLFLRDPYLLPSSHDSLSNVVIEGVIDGVFYPDLQPR